MSEKSDEDYLDDSLFEDVLSSLDVRLELESAGRLAAGIEIEIEEGGPLGVYLKTRREEAVASLKSLVEISPSDAVGIAAAQANINEYLRCLSWVRKSLEKGREAERIIEEERRQQRETGSFESDA